VCHGAAERGKSVKARDRYGTEVYKRTALLTVLQAAENVGLKYFTRTEGERDVRIGITETIRTLRFFRN
jgi:hypothetical protein